MLNYREVELLLSEIPFQDSYIQDVRESDYHSFTLFFFNRIKKAYSVCFEIANENAHFCITERKIKKSRTMQRFTQFLKSRVIGSKVIDVHQLSYDRAFYLKLMKNGCSFYILFRFYSGPGANVIVFDDENTILEVMFRRPKRGEIAGEKIMIEEKDGPGEKEFSVREHPDNTSFNSFIDDYYASKEREESIAELKESTQRAREKELSDIKKNIKRLEEKIRSTEGYSESRKIADLLSSNLHSVKKGMSEITVIDYENDERIRIALRPEKSPRENLEHYYKSYQKAKKSYELSKEELEKEKERLEERSRYFERILSEQNLKKMNALLAEEKNKESARKSCHGPSFISSGYTLIAGRNSKENDEILRYDAKGNDIWLHVRDYPGGYVIIKNVKGRDVPFSVILDAAHLAVHYSRAKDEKIVDLYYTYVKYLRRIKDGKTGLVLVQQEKNLSLNVEKERIKRILSLKVD